MSSNNSVFGFLSLLGIVGFVGFANTRAACPTWVKKDQVTTGSLAQAPQGWYFYGRSDMNGLCKSPITAFNQQVVPNTQSDRPVMIEVSPDGQWIVYLTSTNAAIYIIKRDGTQKKQVPVSGTDWSYPRGAGFYCNGPNGLEVFYVASPRKVRSIAVDVSSGVAQFGAARDVVDLSNGADGLRMDNGGWVGATQINGAHFVSQGMDNVGPTQLRPRRYLLFITIPNGGKDVATASNIWQFNDLPDTSIYGCGTAFSPDGSKLLFNPGSQGDPACIPCRESGLDHKGFVIVPFYETGTPTMSRHAIINDHGISANFCPTSYRWGLHDDVDFTGWKYTNVERYVTGYLGGYKVTTPGAWLVDWQTNTWTPLTSGAVPVIEIAGNIQITAVRQPMPKSQFSGSRSCNVAVFNLRGESVSPALHDRNSRRISYSPRIYIIGRQDGSFHLDCIQRAPY